MLSERRACDYILQNRAFSNTPTQKPSQGLLEHEFWWKMVSSSIVLDGTRDSDTLRAESIVRNLERSNNHGEKADAAASEILDRELAGNLCEFPFR